MEATAMASKFYQIEARYLSGVLRFDTVFSSAERAEQHVQDLNKPFVSVLDGTEYPPMNITNYKIIELRVME
jgi:hypothetical protein